MITIKNNKANNCAIRLSNDEYSSVVEGVQCAIDSMFVQVSLKRPNDSDFYENFSCEVVSYDCFNEVLYFTFDLTNPNELASGVYVSPSNLYVTYSYPCNSQTLNLGEIQFDLIRDEENITINNNGTAVWD